MNTRITLMAAAAATLGLAACTDPNAPYGAATTPGADMSRTQKGAIAGAVLGGIYGLQRDSDPRNKGKDVAEGAIVGALAGGLVGNVLDQQARALESQMTTPGVRVVNTGNSINVTMPESALFAFDSARLSGPAQNDLYAMARTLNQYPNSTVQVIGYTDSVGAAAYNMDLSQRRAQSVANVLIAGNVSPSRLQVAGRGSANPVASNNTAAGRAQNRRVEVIIIPNR